MARLIGFLACTQQRNEKNENISKSTRQDATRVVAAPRKRAPREGLQGARLGLEAGTDWKSFVGIWQTNQLKLSATNGANKNLMCG